MCVCSVVVVVVVPRTFGKGCGQGRNSRLTTTTATTTSAFLYPLQDGAGKEFFGSEAMPLIVAKLAEAYSGGKSPAEEHPVFWQEFCRFRHLVSAGDEETAARMSKSEQARDAAAKAKGKAKAKARVVRRRAVAPEDDEVAQAAASYLG